MAFYFYYHMSPGVCIQIKYGDSAASLLQTTQAINHKNDQVHQAQEEIDISPVFSLIFLLIFFS